MYTLSNICFSTAHFSFGITGRPWTLGSVSQGLMAFSQMPICVFVRQRIQKRNCGNLIFVSHGRILRCISRLCGTMRLTLTIASPVGAQIPFVGSKSSDCSYWRVSCHNTKRLWPTMTKCEVLFRCAGGHLMRVPSLAGAIVSFG